MTPSENDCCKWRAEDKHQRIIIKGLNQEHQLLEEATECKNIPCRVRTYSSDSKKK